MRSKVKLLKLITLLGCSLIINGVRGEFTKCEETNEGEEVKTSTCITKEGNLCVIGYNAPSRKRQNNECVEIAEDGNFFFSRSELVEDFSSNTSITVGYRCIKSNDEKFTCSPIVDDGLYELKKKEGEEVVNYLNKYGDSFQYIENKSSEEGITSHAYLNRGVTAPTLSNAIILCTREGCSIQKDIKDGDVFLYVEQSSDNTTKRDGTGDGTQGDGTKGTGTDKIIKCISNKGCSVSAVSEESIYLNAGDDEKPLIKCSAPAAPTGKRENDNITCTLDKGASDNYYINGLSSKSIIKCTDTASCQILTPPANSYYLNQDGTRENQLINCYGKSCIAQAAEDKGYYLSNTSDEDVIYGVIACENDGELVKCSGPRTNEVKGFLRNADENTNSSYPLLQCTGKDSEGCKSLKIGQDITPGYYIDVTEGEDAAEILICNDNSCAKDVNEFYKNKSNGNYLYTEGKLQLLIDSTAKEDDDNNSKYSATASTSDNIDVLYYFIETASSNGFPGVTTNISTLYKVSKYYIARVITNGAIFVDDATNKATEGGNPGSDTTIYTCSKSKKICTSSKSCVVNTYFLDVQNSIGYSCTSKGAVEQITEDGYYIDSSNGNTKRPVIYCNSGKCTSISNPNYYVNSGSDNNVNPLIYCNGTTCRTSTASNGYYISGVKDSTGNTGIVKCTSATSCSFISTGNIKKTEHYYLNNGNDKVQKAVIKCKNKNCSTVVASEGYFITNDSSILILCENAVSCSTVNASAGFYNAAVIMDTGKKIIECTALASVNCELKDANVGYYVAKNANILINCNTTPCKPITVTNGIYRSATTQVISSKRDAVPGEDENEEVSNQERATTAVVYNIISCSSTGCNELTTSELLSIPVCTFSNNKCFINNRVTISTSTVSAISAGSYCTNSDRSVIYFATDTVVVDPYIIDGSTSIYIYTTTTTNCIEALEKYSDNYYTVGSSIYKVSDSGITQIVATGYYFINVETNTLVGGNNIENYNNENVKLFKCNDSSCSIIDKPETITYYADVNKRIIQYNPNSDSYTFAYDSDIICIYNNNKCTPRSDIKSMEFCITYKGELVLVTNDIKSRETGECHKADGISSKIYGLSQYMYKMNAFSAERIVDTAYYVVSLSTNSTATIRDYDGRNNSVRIYGCVESKCNIVDPKEGVYYYDSVSSYMFRYRNNKWVSPQASGYALVSTDPNDTYINRFSMSNNRTTIDGKVKSGYYYTVDNEMYQCDQDKYQCDKIDNNGYYFTVSGEVYQCIYDSEGIEATECIKKNCLIGQYYYINSKYYYCGSGYMLNLVTDKTCEYDDRVIINFPAAFSESYPDKIKAAVESISTVNNSTALVTNINNKYISAVSGVFTNCTYTVEEKDSEFDLVCINNYVSVNKDKNVEICSLQHMGYVECVDDENNPEKCNPSGAMSRYAKGLTFMFSIVVSTLIYFFL